MLVFLAREEMQAILEAPPNDTHAGQRDRALFMLLYNTGTRISEALSLTIGDILLDGTPRVVLHGNGRKARTVPLWARTARISPRGSARTAVAAPTAPGLAAEVSTLSALSDRKTRCWHVGATAVPVWLFLTDCRQNALLSILSYNAPQQ